MKQYALLRITVIISSIAGVLLIMFGNIKTTENFRILSDFIQNILILNIVLLLFWPDNEHLKIALIIGVFSVILDFIIETIAVHLGLWYPLGGTQFPPIIVVPLEMVLSFFIIGTSIGIVMMFPEQMREMDFQLLNWFKPLFKNPKYDNLWRLLLICVNSVISSFGDLTAGSEILILGPNWQPIYLIILNPWFWGSVMILILYYFLEKKYIQENNGK